MATTELETRVRNDSGAAVIELHGDIDGRADAVLDAAYSEVESSDDVRLDFSGVTYMNSTGIALIVGLLARARKNGHTLSAAGLSHHYREIFEITRLADFMTIVDEEEAA
jgi:anti-sigma B factor antagonist